MKPQNHHSFQDRSQWREWLQVNHAGAAEAWLVITKAKYRGQGLGLSAAVEEALCFGWIDGVLQPVDEAHYLLRFSPRTPKSIWSISNIRRVEALITAGKMTAAGQEKIREAQENGEWEAALRRERVDEIPPELAAALEKVPGALRAYRAARVSQKKQWIYWLQTAKRAETKERRIHKIVETLMGEC